jgi:hypothetical protein
MPKRASNLYPILISDENLLRALAEVNSTHRWLPHHRPNKIVAWVEADMPQRVRDLRNIIEQGFTPSPPTMKRRWDKSAGKWRNIYEPRLWPDQYIHHAIIQALQPVLMRGMDKRRHLKIPITMAQGLLSRLGQMKHCNNRHFFARFVKPKTQRDLKAIVRAYARKERAKWTTSSAQLPATA